VGMASYNEEILITRTVRPRRPILLPISLMLVPTFSWKLLCPPNHRRILGSSKVAEQGTQAVQLIMHIPNCILMCSMSGQKVGRNLDPALSGVTLYVNTRIQG
jgi:hypothetical protein